MAPPTTSARRSPGTDMVKNPKNTRALAHAKTSETPEATLSLLLSSLAPKHQLLTIRLVGPGMDYVRVFSVISLGIGGP